MKKINKSRIVTLLSLSFVFGLIGPFNVLAATNPSLGAAASFSVLAQTGITGTGTISGDVGNNGTGAAITALTTAMVGGTIYSSNGFATTGAPPATTTVINPAVQVNASAVYTTTIPGLPIEGTPIVGAELNGITRGPGVYDLVGASITLSGGVLTLDGAGTYIFRTPFNLTSSGSINFINGARACDLFWRVGTDATINGTSFAGTILSSTGVHFVGAGVTLDGRALAVGADVTLLDTTISGPTCAVPTPPLPATLHVVKTVINDNGGTSVASNFTLAVTGTNVSTSSFAGSETGVEVKLDGGSYTVTEPVVPAGYLQTGSSDCSGTIASGETKTCTITNDDIATATPATLHVVKTVINDNGGTKVIADFPLFIDGGSVISGVASTTAIGLHTVSETSDPGYTSVIGGDCAADGTITLSLGETKTCTITNDDIETTAPPSSSSGSGSSHRSSGGSSQPEGEVLGEQITIVPALVSTEATKLPNAGFPPDEKRAPWDIAILAGLFAVSVFFYLARRKQTI